MEALKGDQASVDNMREQFHARRDKFIAGLNNIKGFSCRLPHGAFYAFPNVQEDRLDIQEAGGSPAERGWRGLSFRYGIRPVRRRLSALQHRQLHGEPGRSAQSRWRLGEEEPVESLTG